MLSQIKIKGKMDMYTYVLEADLKIFSCNQICDHCNLKEKKDVDSEV